MRFLSSKHGVPTLANVRRKSRWNKAMREYEEVYMPPVKAVYDAGPRNPFSAAASSMSTATSTVQRRSCSSTRRTTRVHEEGRRRQCRTCLISAICTPWSCKCALHRCCPLSGTEVCAAGYRGAGAGAAATQHHCRRRRLCHHPKIYVCMHCRQCTIAVLFVRRCCVGASCICETLQFISPFLVQ